MEECPFWDFGQWQYRLPAMSRELYFRMHMESQSEGFLRDACFDSLCRMASSLMVPSAQKDVGCMWLRDAN